MPIRVPSFLVLSTLCVLFASHAARAESRFSPATLPTGDASIESLIELPRDIDAGRYQIICEFIVEKNGANSGTSCIAPEQRIPDDIVDAVRVAHRKARLTPASVDGERRQVRMLTTTTIELSSGTANISVVPNNGADVRLGPAYSAPQIYGTVEPPRFYRVKRWFQRIKAPQYDRVMVFVVVQVGADGRMEGYSLDAQTKVREWRMLEIEDRIFEWKFIPAFHEGKPVRSVYALLTSWRSELTR